MSKKIIQKVQIGSKNWLYIPSSVVAVAVAGAPNALVFAATVHVYVVPGRNSSKVTEKLSMTIPVMSCWNVGLQSTTK